MSTTYIRAGVLSLIAALAAMTLHAVPARADKTVTPIDTTLTISNPCAVFNDPKSASVTRIVYGENIALDMQGQIRTVRVEDGSKASLKIQISARGDGTGQTSGIKYVLNAKALLKAKTVGDPNDPNFLFNGKFRIDARLIGRDKPGTRGGVKQAAQDNAMMHFYVALTVRGSDQGPVITKSNISTFSLECSGSPWMNQMSAIKANTTTPVGRGFGDVWNKYVWSMKNFKGGMVTGTKNAYFDYQQIDDLMNGRSTPYANACYTNLTQVPSIYRGLACAELVLSGTGGSQSSSGAAQSRFAEIWRFDHRKKTWTKTRDDMQSQGFRIMETMGKKLYAGSDLGSFVTGISLGSWNGQPPGVGGTWDFPGSRLLVSNDGKAWTAVDSCVSNGPCNSANDVANPLGSGVNISIRSLASYNGKLYVGTFNTSGAELWSFDPNAAPENAWVKIHTFAGTTGVTELRVFKNTLYIGLGGAVSTNYLYTYGGTGSPTLVSNLPDATGTLGVLKLFPSAKGVLFIGIANVNPGLGEGGFRLYTYDGSSTFTTMTDNGFFNPNNAYAWSINELNGRVFVGTFNSDFFAVLPRGSSELWYTDDLVNWQQQSLPVNWGLWNYGIRTMEIGNKQFFFGTASNVIAPDILRDGAVLPPGETYLSPGAEVWTIRSTKIAPK